MFRYTFSRCLASLLAVTLGFGTVSGATAAESLVKVERGDIDLMYVDASAAGAYRSVYIEPVSVWYPDEIRPKAEALESLQGLAIEQLQSAFRSSGFKLVSNPVEDALVLRVQLIDLRSDDVSEATMGWLNHFAFATERGHVTLVADAIDAESGEAVFRIADIGDAAPPGLQQSLETALRSWGRVLASVAAAEVVQVANKH